MHSILKIAGEFLLHLIFLILSMSQVECSHKENGVSSFRIGDMYSILDILASVEFSSKPLCAKISHFKFHENEFLTKKINFKMYTLLELVKLLNSIKYLNFMFDACLE